MVPLLHREWAEVKTLAIGTIGEPVLKGGEGRVHVREMCAFSRLAEHQSFARLATVETHRRGTEQALQVCAVAEGAGHPCKRRLALYFCQKPESSEPPFPPDRGSRPAPDPLPVESSTLKIDEKYT